jgi:quercetin 2,3-dioxygenase
MLQRKIDRVTATPPLGQGFGGERHRAALVVSPGDLPATDPFFLMADDNITTEGLFGEAHPHAGLETVTFMLNGTMEDAGGRLTEGDVEWMTAGSGIVHAEDASVSAGMRLLQLWLLLPEKQRNIAPRVQILRRGAMPVHRGEGVIATVYSGRSAEAIAPTVNAVPVTLVDIVLEPLATFEQRLPASYNGFMVALEGQSSIGGRSLSPGEVGWTNPVGGNEESSLAIVAGRAGGRVLLYAGQPQNAHVVAKGPFIAGSDQELAGYYAAYRHGEFPNAGSMRPLTLG